MKNKELGIKDLNLQLFAEGGEGTPEGDNTGDGGNNGGDIKKPENADIEGKERDTEGDNEENKPLSLKELLDTNEDIKREFQSELDRSITQAIQTRERKHKEELRKQEERANMTAEELQMEKERELEERENKIRQYELKLKKVEYFKENNIPLDLVDYVMVDNEEEIGEKAEVLQNIINKAVEEKVKEKLKSNGLNIGDEETKSAVSIDDLEGLSIEEINSLWDKVKG